MVKSVVVETHLMHQSNYGVPCHTTVSGLYTAHENHEC